MRTLIIIEMENDEPGRTRIGVRAEDVALPNLIKAAAGFMRYVHERSRGVDVTQMWVDAGKGMTE